MSKRILLVGEFFSENLGDQVLCQTVKKIIESKYPEAIVTPFDMSGKINSQEYYQLHNNYSFWQKIFLKIEKYIPFILRSIPLYRVYKKDDVRHLRTIVAFNEIIDNEGIDIVIFAGGSIFMDYFAGIIYCIIKKLNHTKIQIMFHACGMSKLSRDSIFLIKKALRSKNIVTISLRDSYEKFCSLFSGRYVLKSTFDTALYCPEFYEMSSEKWAEIGIGVINIPELYEFQKSLIANFYASSKSWKIFTNGASYDYEVALKILNELEIPQENIEEYLLNRPTTAEDLIQTVTGFNAIVSFRMHSQIIALAYGIPSFGFIWDSKIKEFYFKLGFKENCMIPNELCENLDFLNKLSIDSNIIKNIVKYEAEESKNNLLESLSLCL